MHKRNVLNSPRLSELKRRRRRAVVNKILLVALGFIIIFSLFAFLSRLNNLNISEVEIVGNKVVDTSIIKTAIEEQISGKYLWLFPKTNILYYPQSAIKRDLQNKFKRIKDINLSIKDNKTLTVSISERTAKYTWCGAVVSTDEKCYFMDENGYIFDESPYFSGEVYFKFYGSTNINADVLGSYFAQGNFQQFVSLKDILVNFGLKPISVYCRDDGAVEISLSPAKASGSTPKIIFPINSDYQKIAENLEAALTTEPLQSQFKNKYSSLLYIDLRYNNKVYYKFQ